MRKHRQGTLASKRARRFLTAYLLAAGGVKILQFGAVDYDTGEGGDVAWRSSRTGIVGEQNGCQGIPTLASKGARRFLTATKGAADIDGRDVGRVLEDGDVTWHTAAARKVRGNVVKGGTGHPRQQGCAKGPHHGSHRRRERQTSPTWGSWRG